MPTYNYHLLDFDVFKDFDILRRRQIVLWGAAEKGRQIKNTLDRIDIKAMHFCDSATNKWDTLYEGVAIISPYRLKEIYQNNPNILVVSCIFRENELIKILEELELEHIDILSYWGIKTACILYGIPLEPEKKLATYDDVWAYQKKCALKSSGVLIEFLKRIASNDLFPVWSWQPGKVGSTTMERRLKSAGILSIHLHDLSYPSYLWEDELRATFYSRVQDSFSRGIKIITGVREPLSRDYSAFWQPFTDERAYLMPILDRDFQVMYERYVELVLKGYDYTKKLLEEAHEWVWNDEFLWFNEQLKKYIGIDIYEYPFDREKGYQIIREGNIQIFIYKTEKLDSIMPILGEFLGQDICSTEDTNQAESKVYHLAYKAFREKVRLPRSYVDHYYKNNPYINHFYTEEEQKMYLSKWKDCIDEQI